MGVQFNNSPVTVLQNWVLQSPMACQVMRNVTVDPARVSTRPWRRIWRLSALKTWASFGAEIFLLFLNLRTEFGMTVHFKHSKLGRIELLNSNQGTDWNQSK